MNVERKARDHTSNMDSESRKDKVKVRFRIERLEERIAPNKGGTPNGGHGGNSGCHLDPICH